MKIEGIQALSVSSGHFKPEPYILGELSYIRASGGWKKNYSWYMVHFNSRTLIP
jgi:hypothetical protein